MHPASTKRLWLALGLILIASFGTLGFLGLEIHRQAPPVPDAVVTADGGTVFTKEQIDTGRQVYQSMGGQQVGSIWGHGAYLAPDWSADWLHREALALLDVWAKSDYRAAGFDDLAPGQQAALKDRLKTEMRANTYDPKTRTVTVSAARAIWRFRPPAGFMWR